MLSTFKVAVFCAKELIIFFAKSKASHLAEMGAILFEGDFANQEAINRAAEGVDAILAITPVGVSGANVMMDYAKAYADGWGDFTTNDVETVTGKKARNFRLFFTDMLASSVN